MQPEMADFAPGAATWRTEQTYASLILAHLLLCE